MGCLPYPPRWGGLDIPVIIAAIAAATASATPNHGALFPSLEATTGMISPLNWLHLRFVCSVSMDTEVPAIREEVEAAPAKQEGISILYH